MMLTQEQIDNWHIGPKLLGITGKAGSGKTKAADHLVSLGWTRVKLAGPLKDMLRAIGLDRQATGQAGVYIANTLKCRPPGNRNPEPQELSTCAPYLVRQVQLVKPRIILAMGRFAVQSLLQTTEPIGKLRGRVHQFEGVPVVVTYHPAYLLRNPADKAKAWADLCLAVQTQQGANAA